MREIRCVQLLKKEFTSFDVWAVVHELRQQICDSRVNNIYQLDPTTFVFKLHKPDTPPLQLVVESGKRLHLTAYVPEKPLHPPDFCMALRKHLRDAWLRDVEQYEFERVVKLFFENKMGKYTLVLELFGDGNLILVGEKGEVVQALVFKRMRDRNILRGECYQPPPALGKNPMKASMEDVEKIFEACADMEVVRAIARSLGVGGVYAEEILARAGVDKSKHCNELTRERIEAVYGSLQSLVSTIVGFKFEPRIVLDGDGSYLDAVPFPLKRYDAAGFVAHGTFNEALDEFYLHSTAAGKASEFDGKVAELQREAEKLKRVVGEQEKSVKEALERSEQEKAIGDLIYAHSVELQSLLSVFSSARDEGKELSTIAKDILSAKRAGGKDEALFESFDARNLAIKVCAGNVCFSLSLRRTLFENAASFYDNGKKAKHKAAGASAALEESRKKLADVMQLIQETEAAKLARPAEAMAELSKRKVGNKQWYEKFRWFRSSDDFLVVAGKDSVSNEVLVKKHANEDDVVFHAEITGAPFVVVKGEGKTPSEQVLREAGEFAAAFSRGWREGMAAVDVYWVKPEQLSKTGPSGEFVPHGAFAVVGKRNWMRGTPLQLAIGVVDDAEPQFIGGPVDAVKARTNIYVTVKPGDAIGKQLLKNVLRALSMRLPKEKRDGIVRASIERVREFVPYTRGRLAEAGSN
jgi:predicted ribosome quality control (RQC) complex YloA/Tae2 family protein